MCHHQLGHLWWKPAHLFNKLISWDIPADPVGSGTVTLSWPQAHRDWEGGTECDDTHRAWCRHHKTHRPDLLSLWYGRDRGLDLWKEQAVSKSQGRGKKERGSRRCQIMTGPRTSWLVKRKTRSEAEAEQREERAYLPQTWKSYGPITKGAGEDLRSSVGIGSFIEVCFPLRVIETEPYGHLTYARSLIFGQVVFLLGVLPD